MLLACGAFVMSEPITSNDYLRPEVDYIVVKNKEELIEKANYYLQNDQVREKIAQNARKRILEVLDSKREFTRLIKRIEEQKLEKFEATAKVSFLFKVIDNFYGFLIKMNEKK